MGNCMEKSAAAPRRLEEEEQEEEEEEEEERGGVVEKEGGGCKVKILLTRKELEWLVLHLKENGEQRLEDVLKNRGREMEKEIRSRKGSRKKGWKPSLERIVECPDHLFVV